ncbi:Sec-independent protein translocase subunit TatA [Pseudonocardia sediminis]|nr:Sec-independent protein translocase subunit TatA [Pseudonocardia sediminis]
MSPVHWLIVVGVLVLLFGAKRLPEAARSIGRSARVLKGEMRAVDDDNAPAPVRDLPVTAPERTPPVAGGPDRHE